MASADPPDFPHELEPLTLGGADGWTLSLKPPASRSIRVLVVDDDPDIREVLRLQLEDEGLEVLTADDADSGIAKASVARPDAVLLDVMMPSRDGIDALRSLRADARTCLIPILLLTARSRARDVVEGLEAGADDYITKPFQTEELLARIQSAVRRSAQQQASNPLTGLPGNSPISAQLASRIEFGTPTALLYVDIDDFKSFNDYYGFLRGDGALRQVADVLVETASRYATPPAFVGHIGGDDFCLITQPEHAEAIAGEVCSAFDALSPNLYDPDDVRRGYIEIADRQGSMERYGLLTLSVGIASTELRRFDHFGGLVTVATEMKRFAKTQRNSASRFASDRRSDVPSS